MAIVQIRGRTQCPICKLMIKHRLFDEHLSRKHPMTVAEMQREQ